MTGINQFIVLIINSFLQIKANNNFSIQISFKIYPQARKRFLFLLTGYGRMLAYRPSQFIFESNSC